MESDGRAHSAAPRRDRTTTRTIVPIIVRAAQGPQGPSGAAIVGPQGNQGPQGIAVVGSQGPQGISIAGTQGPQGIQGPQGSSIVGPQGPQGGAIIGPQGVQGNIGFQGPQGVQGTIGAQGPQGDAIVGPQGIQGPIGTQGPQGISVVGPQGVIGPQGLQGDSIVGAQGPQGVSVAGTQGPQGVQGPRTLNVANTAFVDNVFPSATPVVEDAANPFGTIAAALAAIVVARGTLINIPWRVVVRPGTYPETAAGNVVSTLPNVDIIGSGASTIINATVFSDLESGPSTIASVQVNVPSTANVIVQDSLTVRDSRWSFTPASSAVGSAFALGGTGSPSLIMTDSFVSVAPAAPATTATAFFAIAGTTGPAATVRVANVRGVGNGVGARVVSLDSISGLVTVAVSNSAFDLTVQDAGAGATMSLYGNAATAATGTPEIVWSVDDVSHTLTNGAPGVAPAATSAVVALGGFAFAPTAVSQFVVRDSLFHYVGYPAASVIASASVTIATAADFVQLLDDKWTGLAPSHVPQASIGSEPVVYEGISQSGSVVSSGGLQTGVNVLSSALASYTAVDGDTIIVWAPAANATLTLPASNVFVGKWVDVFNSLTFSNPTITISCSGPANGTVVIAGQSVLLQTFDGTNWFVAAGSQRPVRSAGTAVSGATVPVGGTLSGTALAPAGTSVVGGGFTFTPGNAGVQWSTLSDNAIGSTAWAASIVNTGTVAITGASLSVTVISI